MIAFDIETGPQPTEKILAALPAFDPVAAVPDLGAFDPGAVKVGNLGLDKAAAKIEEARYQHELAAAIVEVKRAVAREQYVAKAVERAALSPLTGQVLAAGMYADDGQTALVYVSPEDGVTCEADIIKTFWRVWASTPSATFVGHNIHGFDLPFLIRRSWILGIDVPKGVQQAGGRHFAPQFVDTMAVWGCGCRDFVKLEDIDKALGGPGKPLDANGQPISGADFARLFHGTPEDREQALSYLRADLEMTRRVAEALQIL
jgi:hypothetical protein